MKAGPHDPLRLHSPRSNRAQGPTAAPCKEAPRLPHTLKHTPIPIVQGTCPPLPLMCICLLLGCPQAVAAWWQLPLLLLGQLLCWLHECPLQCNLTLNACCHTCVLQLIHTCTFYDA